MKDKIIVRDTIFGTIIEVGNTGGYFLQFHDMNIFKALMKELRKGGETK